MKAIKMEKQKRIALVAHDNLKDDLVRWCVKNEDVLKQHFLSGYGIHFCPDNSFYFCCNSAEGRIF